MRIVIINGPNLNLLGTREPEIYGEKTFEEYLGELKEKYPDIQVEYFQSNHEGFLIDKLHEVGFSVNGIVLNAGALTHTSIALSDAVKAISSPVIEVHISDINKREDFRKHSYMTAVCPMHFIGLGLPGYDKAIDYIRNLK